MQKAHFVVLGHEDQSSRQRENATPARNNREEKATTASENHEEKATAAVTEAGRQRMFWHKPRGKKAAVKREPPRDMEPRRMA